MEPDPIGSFRSPWEILGMGEGARDVAAELARAFRVVLPEPGLEEDIVQLVDLFSRSAEAKLRMLVARRVGLPYSEVLERWTIDDLARELAWDIVTASDQWARCPSCGVAPDEVLDPDTFDPLENGRWKLYLESCFVCGELERAKKLIEGDDVAAGTTWRLKPRVPGDQWLDDGGVLADDDDG